MKLARVTGTVTAPAKDAGLTGLKLLTLDFVDAAGTALETGAVAADTCGAGVGDWVLTVCGSAARMPAAVSGLPIDLAIVAVVDRVDVTPPATPAKGRKR